MTEPEILSRTTPFVLRGRFITALINPATGRYLEPDVSNRLSCTKFLLRLILILLSQVFSFLQVFQVHVCMNLSSLSCVHLNLIIQTKFYEGAHFEAYFYAVFYSFLYFQYEGSSNTNIVFQNIAHLRKNAKNVFVV